ncbi:uncharacterized protein A1O9_04198, partial [Exophiala aquamarina CBS 119918]
SSSSSPSTAPATAPTTTRPIHISSDRKTITLHDANGETTTQLFSPTPKISSEKLERALAPLLLPPLPSSGLEYAHSQSPSGWQLDPQHGDAIHRHFAFESKAKREEAIERIMRVADEMKHHPHIARGEWNAASPPQQDSRPWSCFPLTVTCTTHQPRGLSGKDARLAAAVDGLALVDDDILWALEEWDVQGGTDTGREMIRRIREEQARLVGINRRAIADALSSCGCADAKAE